MHESFPRGVLFAVNIEATFTAPAIVLPACRGYTTAGHVHCVSDPGRLIAKGGMMAGKNLHDLFVEELRDMYDAEKRIIKALPKIAKHAESPALQAALTKHLKETQKQAMRLEQVFGTIGEKPRAKKCDGMMGILEEGNTAMEDLEKGPVLDAALIAGCQKVEHYEIASYGTLAYFAELLGNDRAKTLLGATLDEEKAADEKLSQIAMSDVNREALSGDSEQEEDDPPSRRATSSMAMANDRTSGRSKRTSSGRGRSAGRRR